MRQHTRDSYAGVRLSKLPEDLRTYEHLMWSDRPDTVIEIGTQCGGSALWFRDRLRILRWYGLIGEPRVVTIDIDHATARRHLRRADPNYAESIDLVEGDVRDPALAEHVGELVGKRCLVVEDSAHEYDTTLAALTSFAGFVPTGGYFVVEDGCVDVEARSVSNKHGHVVCCRRCVSGYRPDREGNLRCAATWRFMGSPLTQTGSYSEFANQALVLISNPVAVM